MKKSIFKKLILLFFVLTFNSFTQNWFPLKVGNTWDYWTNETVIGAFPNIIPSYIFKMYRLRVVDTLRVSGNLYYRIIGHPRYPDNNLFRYDQTTKRLSIYYNNTDNNVMDFSLVGGDGFTTLIYGPNNQNWSNINATVFETFIEFQGQNQYSKGYHYQVSYLNSYNYFLPNIGLVKLNESTSSAGVKFVNASLVEYRLRNDDGTITHYKHNNKANIIYNPITFLQNQTMLRDTFELTHPYNFYSTVTSSYWSYIYIDSVFIESYYSNGFNSMNFSKSYSPLLTMGNKIKSTINITIDTTLYNSGYFLYYRIGVKDKGIVPSYFYLPDTGFVKLRWRDTLSSTKEDLENEMSFTLYQNYPNPFGKAIHLNNSSTRIKFSIPAPLSLGEGSGVRQVTLKVYNILGKEVATLVDEHKQPGTYEIDFNVGQTISLSSGVYFYQLRVGNQIQTKKMILMR